MSEVAPIGPPANNRSGHGSVPFAESGVTDAGRAPQPAQQGAPRQSSFRLDVEGMRGVAVAIVVLFHAELSWFSGGFVGVDVFFVLSGFLITGLLLDERDRSGRISFGDFYARRARRLLPASILVFVATILAAVAMMSPLDLLDLGSQARWTALFGSNIWFARHTTDYLQPDVISPFQQYWSLAVEEQFYLIWPPVILLLALGARSRRALLKRVGIGLGVICVASFTSAVWLTAVRQPSAFFLLPPRAWELGAGGLLAIALRLGLRVRPRMRNALALLGAAAVVLPTLRYGAATVFPGWAALPPVLGTVALLAAGTPEIGGVPEAGGVNGSVNSTRPVITRLLETRPLRLIGKYSYSLYLWHWPVLVLPAAAAGRRLTSLETLQALVLSVALAVCSYHLVEDRFRHLKVLVRRPALSYGFGIAVIAVAVISVGALPTKASIAESASRKAAAEGGALSSELAEAVVDAPDDQASVYANDCHRPTELDENAEPVEPSKCVSGVTGEPSAPTVMLLGDSHAAHWQPALAEMAKSQGWKLVSLSRSFCPLVEVPVELTAARTHYDQCDTWREQIFDLVARTRPTAVVLGHRSSYYVGQVGRDEWTAALGETVAKLAQSTRVLVLRDLPNAPGSVPKCILSNSGDVEPCEFGVKDAAKARVEMERNSVIRSGGMFIDPLSIVCPDDRCDVIDGDLVIYSDSNHLTASYSRSVADDLARLIAPALGI